MSKKQHSLWIEKYRSKTLDQYIGNDEIKKQIAIGIKDNDIPHFLFAGSAGTGKTTLAKLIVGNIECDYVYLNASDENGIDVIREKVKGFASSATFQPIKVVILDEADYLTNPAQMALRNIIEEYSLTTRFILTCNYIDNIIEPLQSRCETYTITPPSKGDVAKHIAINILDVEKVEYELPVLAQYVEEHYPDVRSTIKYIQAGVKIGDGKLVWVKENRSCRKLIVEKLTKPTLKTWIELRQIIADHQVDDYVPLYRELFDNLDKFSNGNDAELIVMIDEYMWRARSTPDKEINFSACMSRVLEILTKKKVIL
jgi:replication factor C small subunit